MTHTTENASPILTGLLGIVIGIWRRIVSFGSRGWQYFRRRPGENPAYHLERIITVFRWIAIGMGGLLTPIEIIQNPNTLLSPLHKLLVLYAAGIAVMTYLKRRYPNNSRLAEGSLTTIICDGPMVLALTWTQGFDTSSYFNSFVWACLIAMRFGIRWGVIATILVGATDLIYVLQYQVEVKMAILSGKPATKMDAIVESLRSRTLTLLVLVSLASYLRYEAQRAHKALALQLKGMTKLADSSAMLNTIQSVDEVAARIVLEGRNLVQANYGAIYVVNANEDTPEEVIEHVMGGPAPAMEQRIMEMARLLTASAKQAIRAPERERPPLEPLLRHEPDETAWLGVPLMIHETMYGAVVMAWRHVPDSQPPIDILQAFLGRGVAWMENARLYAKVRQQAIHDPVTGLPNHRHMRERLQEEVSRAHRYGHPLSVLMLDLDDFKAFNDRYGHVAGDQALHTTAQTLRRIARASDLVARYGGEEFLIILPETSLAEALEMAERLCQAIAQDGAVTVSIGATSLPAHGTTPEALINTADLAMYLAKRTGKDRVCSAADVHTEEGIREILAEVAAELARPMAERGPILAAEVERRLRMISQLQDGGLPGLDCDHSLVPNDEIGTVAAFAQALGAKDSYTCFHSQNVAHYTFLLAKAAGMDDATCENIRIGGLLHDLGKIGISDAVLNKPSALTPEEFEMIKQHPIIGAEILEKIKSLDNIIPFVKFHHEFYNGGGYPTHIGGEEIPLGARMMAICDAFDAMTTDRPYRRAMSLEEARERLLRGSGTQFDPALVPVFLGLLDDYGDDMTIQVMESMAA